MAARLLLLAAFALAASAAQQRFAVAIVRPDGRLVPFAAHEDGRWEPAWPTPEYAPGRPSIADVQSAWRKRGEPVPRTWRVWLASGAPSFETRVTGLEVVRAHCGEQVALATGLRAVKVDHPGKPGIATDSEVPVTAIQAVPRTDATWGIAEAFLAPHINRMERAAAEAERRALPAHDSPIAELRRLYREAGSAMSPLYFVAEKKYSTARSPQDPGCTDTTVVTGWLFPDGVGRFTLHDAKVFLTDCDEKVARTAWPLAAIHLPNQLVWILQEHGYEDESYVVADITARGVRRALEVGGGGC